MMDKEEKYFKDWYESQERMFHTCSFSDKEIAFSAFNKGIDYKAVSDKTKQIEVKTESVKSPDIVFCEACGTALG